MKVIGLALAVVGLAAVLYVGLLLVVPLKVLNAWPADHEEVAYGPLERQRMDVYRSKRRNADTLVFFHGGNWDSGSKEDYRFVATALVQQGFDVVVPSYRLEPFPAFMQDAALALKAVGAGGTSGRMLVMGHSAGAHIAALLALDESYLAGVGSTPCTLIDGWVGLAGAYDFLPITKPRTARVFPPETRAESQPLAFAGNPSPPALLVHGTADETVHVEDTQLLEKALRRAGTPVEAVYLEGAGHRDVIGAFGRGLGWTADVRAPLERFREGLPKREC